MQWFLFLFYSTLWYNHKFIDWKSTRWGSVTHGPFVCICYVSSRWRMRQYFVYNFFKRILLVLVEFLVSYIVKYWKTKRIAKIFIAEFQAKNKLMWLASKKTKWQRNLHFVRIWEGDIFYYKKNCMVSVYP